MALSFDSLTAAQSAGGNARGDLGGGKGTEA